MEYTLSQFRDLVGLSLETHRHWKRVLPPVRRKTGRSPCFTVGDLIAGLVVRRLAEDAGVRVGSVVDFADELFQLCNLPWASLEGATICLDLRQRTCTLLKGRSANLMAELVLVCRLDPILAEVRASLLKDQTGTAQAALPFGPVGVRAEPRRRA